MPKPHRKLPILSQQDVDRLWSKIERRGPGECWPWLKGFYRQGYGRFSLHSRDYGAHRVMYAVAAGRDPGPLDVLHRCDNPPCCNPEHLFEGTHGDNMQDMNRKGRRQCAKGEKHGSRTHPESRARGNKHWARRLPERVRRGERCGRSKLTPTKVKLVLQLRAQGWTQWAIAHHVGVSQAEISKIDRGQDWKHIPR